MGQGTSVAQINAMRHRMSPGKIKERWEAGEDVSNQRAVVRVGKMTTQILIGAEDLADWSDEELRRGRRRDKNGGWVGKDPVVVPKALHDELVRRTADRAHGLLVAATEDAARTVVSVMMGNYEEDAKNGDPKAKDRLKAAEMIINRVLGKDPIQVQLSAAKTLFDQAFDDMMVYDEGDLAELEEAEVVDDDDD